MKSKTKFIIYLLTFILLVNPCMPIYASEFNDFSDDISGWDSWSTSDKALYWTRAGGTLLGALVGVGGYDFKDFIALVDGKYFLTEGYSSYAEFCAFNSSYNVADDKWTFTDDFMDFLNVINEEMNNDITYQYRYMPTSNQLKADSFRTRNAYAILKELISSHPDKMFCVSSARHSYDGKNNLAGLTVRVYDLPYGAVNSFSDLAVVNCTFYTEEWQSIFHMVELYIVDHDANNSCLVYKDSDGVFHEIQSAEEIKTFDLNSSAVFYDGGVTEPLGFSHSSFNSGASAAGNCFSDTTAAIPVFKSVADLKNGTSVGNCAQIMPGYTGQPITDNSITQTEINDFSTNYNNYYGSGSGGSGSGSGSSSGSSGGWLSSLLSGLGNIGDIIMSLLAKAVEIITEILKFFTDTILDAIDIIPTGFVEFLTALFPMIPEEWITCVNLALALMLIGIIVKIFK